MIEDKNKQMTVQYNFLNLPTLVDFGSGNKIEWTYTATGAKLQKKVYTNGSLTLTQDYVSGFVYKNGSLDFFSTETGRVKNQSGTLKYQYTLTDHLGNTRVMFDDAGVAIEESHYYAFGMRIEGLSTSNPDNKFTYNGKELEEDHGLNWYHYGARFYDAQIGRWHVVDPGDEYHSPYVFVGNDIVNAIDPSGEGTFEVRVVHGTEKVGGGPGNVLHHAQFFLSDKEKYSFNNSLANVSLATGQKLTNIGVTAEGNLFWSPAKFFMETDPGALSEYRVVFELDDGILVQAVNNVLQSYKEQDTPLMYGIGDLGLFEDVWNDVNCQTFGQDVLREYDKIGGTDFFEQYNRLDPVETPSWLDQTMNVINSILTIPLPELGP